jgi:hypothetical protein
VNVNKVPALKHKFGKVTQLISLDLYDLDLYVYIPDSVCGLVGRGCVGVCVCVCDGVCV